MPIVSISKIQHRYGLSENLPQLSAAELGWVIDERRLFIGNGPPNEGAPEVGNTEILTEHSDILGTASTYTYSGIEAGYTVQTGASEASPIRRTLQSKLDDFANVKDFGAVGDGNTDDTAAINRALNELFCRSNTLTDNDATQVRRVLYFPAGTYIVTDVIKIPSYAMIKGEGANCTVIRQTSLVAACTARTADSQQQVGANIGNNGATPPQYIDIIDISFENIEDNDVFLINSSSFIRFHKALFRGPFPAATSVGNAKSCVKISGTAVLKTSSIVFEQCEFRNQNFGIVIDDDVVAVSANNSRFVYLYKGIKLGENKTGSGSSVVGPRAFHVSNSVFDDIYSVGLHAYEVSDIYSSFNHYRDVGNHLVGTPFDNAIIFGDDGCSSVCDTFDRSDANDILVPRVNLSNKKNYYLQPDKGVVNGRRQQQPAIRIALADNTAIATSTGITMSATTRKASHIYYTAARGSNIRQGVLAITASASGATISDSFQEDGADIGLTFSVEVSGGNVILKYATTSTGNAVQFTYSLEHMNYA